MNKLQPYLVPGVLVGVIAFQMFWPKSSITLVSPDGSSRVSISATNQGAKIELLGQNDNGDRSVILEASPEERAPTVKLYGGSGTFDSPSMILYSGSKSRIIAGP